MDRWVRLEHSLKKAREGRATETKASAMEKAEEGPYTVEGVPINWDGKNWRNYKYVVAIVLKRQGLWEVATGAIERESLQTAEEQANFDRKNLDIQRILATSMTQEMLEQFLVCPTGRGFWKALCDKFENETVKTHAIRRLTKELWSAKFEPQENIDVHLQRMRNVCRELRNYEHRIDDELLVELILESLPSTKEFNSLKGSIYYSNDRVVDIDILEELIKYAHLPPDAEELQEPNKHGFVTQGHGSGSQEAEKDTHPYRSSSAANGKKKKSDGCYECGGDHFKRDCPKLNAA